MLEQDVSPILNGINSFRMCVCWWGGGGVSLYVQTIHITFKYLLHKQIILRALVNVV